jgi:hypothetical protein
MSIPAGIAPHEESITPEKDVAEQNLEYYVENKILKPEIKESFGSFQLKSLGDKKNMFMKKSVATGKKGSLRSSVLDKCNINQDLI